MAASIIGMRMMPELVADLPSTALHEQRQEHDGAEHGRRLDGAGERAETVKMLFSKRRGLITGSAARSSRRTNTTHMTAEKTKRPTICGEPQGYSLPPQLRPSRRGTAAATSSAAPL